MAFPRPCNYSVAEVELRPHSLRLIPHSDTWTSLPAGSTRGRFAVGITAHTFLPSVPLHPVLPVLFEHPSLSVIKASLGWAASWHLQQEAECDVSCCWERRWNRQPRNKDRFTSQLLTECLCLHGTEGTIGDGTGSVLNLTPADKWKPGASLWFYRVMLAFGQS